MPNEEHREDLIAALHEMASAQHDYTTKYVSTKPLDDREIPQVPFDEINEATNRVILAEKKYQDVRKKYYGY